MALTYVWSQLSPTGGPPSIRAGHVSWIVGNYAYIFGGYQDFVQYDSTYTLVTDPFWQYDLVNNTWSQLSASGPQGRSGASAWVFNSDLYLFGGMPGPVAANGAPPTTLNDFWRYNITTNQWTQLSPASSPPARGYAATWQYGQNFYIAGGTSYTLYTIDRFTYPLSLQDTWMFNPITQTWTQLANAYYQFYGATTWVLGSTAFINVGIRDDSTAFTTENNHIFQFNCLTNTWVSQTSVTFHAFATSGTCNNQGLLISGENFQNFTTVVYVADQNMLLYQQDLSDQQIPVPFGARCKATAWSTPTTLYLFGGGADSGGRIPAIYNDLWTYQLVPPIINITLIQSDIFAATNQLFSACFTLTVSDASTNAAHVIFHFNGSNVLTSDYTAGTVCASLQAPPIASDYLLTITAYDPGYPSSSDTATVTVHVASLTISDLKTPLSVYTGSSFDISFLLDEQNSSGIVQTALNWNNSDYNTGSVLVKGEKIFWGGYNVSNSYLYAADLNLVSPTPYNTQSFLLQGLPAGFRVASLTVDSLHNTLYVSGFSKQDLYFGRINYTSNVISLNRVLQNPNLTLGQNLIAIFFDQSSRQIYLQTSTAIYTFTVETAGTNKTLIPVNQNPVLSIATPSSFGGFCIDDINHYIYYIDTDPSHNDDYSIFVMSTLNNSTPINLFSVSSANSNSLPGLALNINNSKIYWILDAADSFFVLWQGTINNPSNPTAITNMANVVGGFSVAPTQIPAGLYTTIYDGSQQNLSLQAPPLGSDYVLSVTAYDSVQSNYSDIETTTIHVMQLAISDNLNRTLVATGDPYTISWSAQVINQQPNTSPVVVNVLRPEGLSSNHYGIGEVQDMAPLIPSDYPIIITACTSDRCISDTLLLHVKNLVISAGSDQIINYGQHAQLGSPTNDQTATYTWFPSDGLSNPNSAAPTATPLTTTAYTIVGYQPLINRYASDSVIIVVVAPITVSDTITPSLTYASAGGFARIAWYITTPLPTPNYQLTITRFDGSTVLSSNYSNVFSGVVSDAMPTIPGTYHYYLSVMRNDYGNSSAQASGTITVVQPHIKAWPSSPIVPSSDPYSIQWIASLDYGQPSDILTVTINAPGTTFTSDCFNGTTYQKTFNAPSNSGDFPVTINAAYKLLPGCSDATSFILQTKRVTVDAGSDMTIPYNTSVTLGVGFEDPDIAYTWSPSDWLNTTTGLHPTATPLSDRTYTVVAFRSDVQRSASDSVTLTVVAPIHLSNVQINPSTTWPGAPITISFNVSSDGPALNYQTIIQRSDGPSLPFANYTASSVVVSDTAPALAACYPYIITVIRNDFGGLSDQQIVYLNVTQVFLSDVQAITNPTPVGDPYLIQWSVYANNPQPDEVVKIHTVIPDDQFLITPENFTAFYHLGETGITTVISPSAVSDYTITVAAFDEFGSSDTQTITLQTRYVTVDAGPDQIINYGDPSNPLGLGLQESDISYTWTPSDGLDNPNRLHPIASPLATKTYTVLATRDFGSGVVKSVSDSVTIVVVAPIVLSNVTITPALTCASSGSLVQIAWQIASSDPTPNYHMLVTRPDGTVVLSSDYSNSISGFAVDTTPAAHGVYPYYLYVTRNDYGYLSDTAVVNLRVVQAEISAGTTPFISTSDQYHIHWTASALGGYSSDTLSVTILAPDSPPFTTASITGQTYDQIFEAPNYVSDFTVTCTATYDALTSCTSSTFFTVGTRKAAVDAGPDRTINYGDSTTLGRGLADPDIVYTWSPSDWLSTTTGLRPLAAPVSDITYQVVAFRADVNSYAADTVTITVVAPITLLDVNVSPTPTAPGTPLLISWNLSDYTYTPTLDYQAIIQRSDGSIVSSDNYTTLSGMVSDTAPLAPGTYPYTVTIIRNNFGHLSDQHSAYLNVTQVFLSDVQAITNPTPVGDPYLIQWSVYANNPQPGEVVKVHIVMPSDQFAITPEEFTALYNLNETGEITFLAPPHADDYPITVTVFDSFGSSDSKTIILHARDVTVDAGPNRTISYGSDTVLGIGLQESDIVYTWSPSDTLSTSTGLHPSASPVSDTPYTVIAFRSDIGKTKSDTVTISVIASIELSDVTVTPALVSTSQPLQIAWQILTPDPAPSYHLTITRHDGTTLLSSDYTGIFSGTVSDISPSTFGSFPYSLSAVRHDYGQLSDTTVVNAAVVQAHIEANAFPNPTSNSDPYDIQWTASIRGGSPSDTLTVTIDAPDTSQPFVSDSINNLPYKARFWAPDISSDYLITVTATYDLIPACSDTITFTLATKRVVVDAGSDQTIDYGNSATLGAGIADHDVVYTWSPSDTLSAYTSLNPVATPLVSTTYTVVAFRSDVQHSASDSIRITVVAPIQLDVGWL